MHKLSVVLLSYNQEVYIKDALVSLLQQTVDDLEIVISDDASTDRSVETIQRVLSTFNTKKTIKLNINPTNLGIAANLNHALGLASGDLIFIAGGDDISINTRCSDCYQFWLQSGAKHDLLATDGYDMSQDGVNLGIKTCDSLEQWTLEQWHKEGRPYFFGASFMVSKKLIQLNPLDTSLPFEDQVYVHRALMMGGAIRLPSPLVHHRRGGVSQPEKHAQIGSKKQRLLSTTNADLIELNQFVRDADKLEMGKTVRALFNSKYALAAYKKTMLESERLSEKIGCFLKSKNINLSKRLRFLKYGLFYR